MRRNLTFRPSLWVISSSGLLCVVFPVIECPALNSGKNCLGLSVRLLFSMKRSASFSENHAIVLEFTDGATFISKHHTDRLDGERVAVSLRVILFQLQGDVIHSVYVMVDFRTENVQSFFLFGREEFGSVEFV